MAGLAAGVRKFPEQLPPIVLALLTGLNAAAVGLIALAAFQLSRTAITDKLTRLLVLGSASFGICYHAPWVGVLAGRHQSNNLAKLAVISVQMYPVLVATGGILTLLWDYKTRMLDLVRNITDKRGRRRSSPSFPPATEGIELESRPESTSSEARAPSMRNRMRSGGSTLSASKSATAATPEARHIDLMVLKRQYAIPLAIASVTVIVALIITKSQISMPPRWLDFFVNMFIAGVIIFGGGPVVIPLLREYTVVPGQLALSSIRT